MKVSYLKLCNVLLHPVNPERLNSLAVVLLNTLRLLGNPWDKKVIRAFPMLPSILNDI